MYYSTTFLQFFIKNGSHGTIHTFKNYFAIVFSVFSKISYIKTDSYSLFHLVDIYIYIYITFSFGRYIYIYTYHFYIVDE